jgi:hypothetical protein
MENLFYKCVLESHFIDIYFRPGRLYFKKAKIVVPYCTYSYLGPLLSSLIFKQSTFICSYPEYKAYILLNKCFSLHTVTVVVCQPLMLCMYTNVMWAWKQGEMPKSWHGFTRVPTQFD